MKVLTSSDAERELARALHQWIVVVSGFALLEDVEVYGNPARVSCAPYLHPLSPAVLNGRAIILCDTEQEAWEVYELTHGDDGVTVRGRDARKRVGAPLTVTDRVYCCIINPSGEPVTENT